MLKDFAYRVRAIFRRRRLNDELDEELRDHIEREAEKYVHAGMSGEVARRKALIAIGGIEQARQRTRESRGTGAVEHLRQDLRYGLRSLGKNRGFTIVFVLTLGLGIGSCTAIFSLMTAVMFPPLPYGTVGRLVYIYTPNHNFSQIPPDAIPPDNADFVDLKRENHSLSALTQFDQKSFRLNGTGVSLGAAGVDANFFSTLQSSPMLGRAINADDNEPGHSSVVVISHSVWQQVFGSDPGVVGKPLQLDDKAYRVIGVMPPGFQYPHKTDLAEPGSDTNIAETDIWVPLALTAKQRADRNLDPDCYALGRLKDGVTVEQAASDLSAIMHQLDPLHEGMAFRQGWYAYLKPLLQTLQGSARPLLLRLMGAVVFVLLIACGNAANLLLARSAGRAHELGVRATLGAGRTRLVRQMLTESLLLGAGGGLAGIALARVFLRLLLALDPGDIPRLQQSSLNGRVLAFAVVVSVVTSLLAGALPAVSASRVNLVEFLKAGGQKGAARGRYRFRGSLIIAQVTIVVVLLAGAGLLVRSYVNLMRVPMGFNASTVSMKIELPRSYAKPAQCQAFFESLLPQLRSMPGTLAAAAVVGLPLGDTKGVGTFWVEGYPNQQGQVVDGMSVTPDYFSAMGTPILRGHTFTQDEIFPTPKAAIINEAFAEKYFAGRDPIGKWVSGDQPEPGKPVTGGSVVVGVAADERDWSVEAPAQPQLFTPLRDPSAAYIVIRSALPRKDVMASATAVLHRIDSSLTFAKVHTMQELVSEATARQRFQTVLLSSFAAMAMALALIGFYGLLAYSVNQRSAEMGVRIALGATRGHVMQLVLRQGLALVTVGLAVGLVLALGLTRVLASSLFGVSSLDPVTFAAVPTLFLAATLAACLIPARRAARSDPIAVLRSE